MDNDGCFAWVIYIGLGCLGLYLLYLLIVWVAGVFVYLGIGLFSFLGYWFYIPSVDPVLMWGIFGFLFGGLFGVIIAIKKLKLSWTLILYPLGVLILALILSGFVNKYPPSFRTSEKPPAKQEIIVEYFVTNTDANVRNGHSLKNPVLFVLKKGSEVEVKKRGFLDSRKKEWYLIGYAGKEGYVSARLLTHSRAEKLLIDK